MQGECRFLAKVALIASCGIAFLAGCSGSGDSGFADDNPVTVPPPPPPPTGGSGNQAPTISGTPPLAVVVGSDYSFTPSASDPDGDPLTFSILNQPDWATFDSDTGRLSGRADAGSEGMYANIRITVSDGEASSSLPDFSIEVTQVAIGSVTLTWEAPILNSDGSTLTDLAAYKLYYGTSSRNYTNQIQIENPGVTTYVVENLVADTYYFAITALNNTGEESDFSGEATHTIMQ